MKLLFGIGIGEAGNIIDVTDITIGLFFKLKFRVIRSYHEKSYFDNDAYTGPQRKNTDFPKVFLVPIFFFCSNDYLKLISRIIFEFLDKKFWAFALYTGRTLGKIPPSLHFSPLSYKIKEKSN